MSGSRIPKFRVPAALVSPASLCLIGGICYYFTLDFASEDELNDNIQKEFPDVVRSSREVDDRMKEFFRRVNSNDPKEEERMRNLMNKGKGSHYSPKRRHATTQEIQDFGFVPKSTTSSSSSSSPSSSPPASTLSLTSVSPAETSIKNKSKNKNKKSGMELPAPSGRDLPGGEAGAGAGGGGPPRRNRWWFW